MAQAKYRRTAERNKQTMYYALISGTETDYATDDDGNILVDDDGNKIETGTVTTKYDAPVKFRASISSSINTLHAREYGIDQTSIYSEIQCDKDEIPLDFGAKIWRTTEPTYLSDGTPDPESAEYTIRGLLTEFIHYDWYLLQRDN